MILVLFAYCIAEGVHGEKIRKFTVRSLMDFSRDTVHRDVNLPGCEVNMSHGMFVFLCLREESRPSPRRQSDLACGLLFTKRSYSSRLDILVYSHAEILKLMHQRHEKASN